MIEIWKDIQNYEGLYQVSNLGRVKSIIKKIILKNMVDKCGYEYVHLSKNNVQKRKSIHRLVAETFLDNKNNLPCVNHKDENKQNNNINNLEWCTYSYNNNYGTKIKKQSEKMLNNKKRSKQVIQYNLKNDKINEYLSLREAERQTKIKYIDISKCCKNKRKTAGGYIWKFKEEGDYE